MARGLLGMPGMKQNPHTSHRPSPRTLDTAALAGVTGGASAPRDASSGDATGIIAPRDASSGVLSPRDPASGLPT
jgi:hypothetical protein